ncbi:MAG: hypothetical protein V4649_13710 [Bacteroidota bacterium]
MKKLLIITALGIIGVSSCYKEKDPPDVKRLLTDHKWYMQNKLENGMPVTSECALSEEITFKKDSTGYFYNPNPCDTLIVGADSVFFNWYLSADKKNIYFKNLRGAAGANTSFGISGIDKDNLRITGNFNGGNVTSFYNKND